MMKIEAWCIQGKEKKKGKRRESMQKQEVRISRSVSWRAELDY